MKKFHVIIVVNQMPLQFDVAEMVENNDLKFRVSTPNHGSVLVRFDTDAGEYKIEGHADIFWQQIENDLSYKIQFENL